MDLALDFCPHALSDLGAGIVLAFEIVGSISEQSLLMWPLHSHMDSNVRELLGNSPARFCLEGCSHVVGLSGLEQKSTHAASQEFECRIESMRLSRQSGTDSPATGTNSLLQFH